MTNPIEKAQKDNLKAIKENPINQKRLESPLDKYGKLKPTKDRPLKEAGKGDALVKGFNRKKYEEGYVQINWNSKRKND